jgi:hypothetical protein
MERRRHLRIACRNGQLRSSRLSSSFNDFEGMKMTAMEDVASERKRQIEVEKYMTDEDDTYVDGQLARAAVCYATTAIVTASLLSRGLDPALIAEKSKIAGVPSSWPWDHAWWKPRGARRDLVRAAALIIAEIERLDRAAITTAVAAGGGDAP